MFFFILIACLPDIVMILRGESLSLSLVGAKWLADGKCEPDIDKLGFMPFQLGNER